MTNRTPAPSAPRRTTGRSPISAGVRQVARGTGLALLAVAAVAAGLVFDPSAPPAAAFRAMQIRPSIQAAEFEEDVPGIAAKRCRQVYYWSVPAYPYASHILVQFLLRNYLSETNPHNQNGHVDNIRPGTPGTATKFQSALTVKADVDRVRRDVEVVPATTGEYHGLMRGSYGERVPCGEEPSWVAGYDAHFSRVSWEGPAPAFTWTVTDPATHEVTFANTSVDEDGDEGLTYVWDFGDGGTDAVRNPVHRFPDGGSYPVSLRVTEEDGDNETLTQTVVVPDTESGLVVNTTGDEPADDPARGCDTGETVGDDPACSLRAALEVASQRGGGEITFAIDGASTPTIAAASELPAVTASTSIDGTTQPGGWVQLQATGDAGLRLTGGTSTVTGLSIRGAGGAVLVTGGSGHRVEGNHLGVDAGGTVADAATTFGVGIKGRPGIVVADNVSAAGVGVLAEEAADLEVTGNTFGVGDDGTTPLGDPLGGVVVTGRDAEVRDNVIRADSVGVGVLSAGASGATVTDNRIGVDGAGATAFDGSGFGVYVDAAPAVTVSGNHVVAGGDSAIVVSGSKQYEVDGDGYELRSPTEEPLAGAVTGGGTTVADNTIGLAGGADVADDAARGVTTWAGATNVVVSGNVLGGTADDAVELRGGSGHRVVGNTLGLAGEAGSAVGTGVSVEDADDVVVGAAGTGNQITSTGVGVAVSDGSDRTRVEANTITAADDEGHDGIAFEDGATVATVGANTVTGGASGITVTADGAAVTGNTVTGVTGTAIQTGDSATVIGNRVADASTAILAADEATVTGNQVTESDRGIAAAAGSTVADNTVSGGADGITVGGADVAVTGNRVGAAAVAGDGVTGTGITVLEGDAAVTRNQVAGSGAHGIDVRAGATATLRANRVWDSESTPLAVAAGPGAPQLAAAIATGSGTTLRRTLLVTDLPEGDAGTIEVFANPTCTDPEAELLMEIARTKDADETTRIIQVRDAPTRDHFTVTYTDGDGRTSELSNCESGDTYADGDGDGSVDPLDEVLGLDDDQTAGIVATDGEQLLLVQVAPLDPETGVGGGRLTQLGASEDPAPGTHPAGWSLPYGAIGFRVEGLDAGGRTRVALATLTGTDAIGGTSYWKYGPAATGAAPSWYPFAYGDASGTGARLSSGTLIAGELRQAWLLDLGDGLRGDADGGANGTITDPGGPVLGAVDPVDPTTTTTSTTPPTSSTTPPSTTPSTSSTSTPSGPSSTVPQGGPSTSAAPAVAPAGGAGGGPAPLTAGGTLARTGTEARGQLAMGAALLLVGGAVLAGRRRVQRTVTQP